ncbi:MAG: FkbM family methyltransferase [Dechloromonas sp.]|uniref:FkbM family methyltransferase n=1 Tax=Dechloromonas sp. TaxID=1917218 RepID=UPI0027E9B12A|nr:FkbM family methyltransferase [Dechloromonas sp.]MBT9520027.1 FkbM family methyltransferase [Dechloromonas sp.]
MNPIYQSSRIAELVTAQTPLTGDIESQFANGIGIYGAGFVGTWAHRYLESLGAKISCFIDRDPAKQGRQINGVTVVAPESKEAAGVKTLLIAARHAVQQVTADMTAPGRLAMSFDGYFVVRNYAHLAAVRDQYFSDTKSIETFNALLLAMLSGSTRHCRAVMVKDMYFCLPEFSGNFDEVFVDAGAFVGDTVERFIWENLGTFRHIYAFEPGKRQFAAMEQRLERLAGEWAFNPGAVSLVNAGLSSEQGRMACTFENDFPLRHGLASVPPETEITSGNFSEVFSLDNYLGGQQVTLLKADVEGMEMDLLRGARETILRHRPRLAICVYHYPSDLHEVAEYIRDLVPEYKFSLRQHAPIFGDFVLYAWIN